MTAPLRGRALVVANASDADPGFVGERLEQRGYQLDVVLRDGVPGLPAAFEADDRPDLLVLLGSEWSVATPHGPARLEAETVLLRSAVTGQVPVLAICYGAQLLARAYGGEVRRAAVPEIGLVDVDTTDPELIAPGPWSSFHTDVLVPPADARTLATNGCGVQAFSLPGVLAVQFHPEVRPEVLDDWADRYPALVAAAGTTRADLLQAAAGRADESRVAAYRLVDAFLDRVAGAAAAQREAPSTSPNATA